MRNDVKGYGKLNSGYQSKPAGRSSLNDALLLFLFNGRGSTGPRMENSTCAKNKHVRETHEGIHHRKLQQIYSRRAGSGALGNSTHGYRLESLAEPTRQPHHTIPPLLLLRNWNENAS